MKRITHLVLMSLASQASDFKTPIDRRSVKDSDEYLRGVQNVATESLTCILSEATGGPVPVADIRSCVSQTTQLAISTKGWNENAINRINVSLWKVVAQSLIPKQTPLPRLLVRQQDLEERGFDPALYRAAVQAYQENPSSTTVDLMGMTHPVLWMTEEEQEADIDQDNFTLDTILKALEITDKYK